MNNDQETNRYSSPSSDIDYLNSYGAVKQNNEME